MVEELFRYEVPVDAHQLPAVLAGELVLPLSSTGRSANLEPVDKLIARLRAKGKAKKTDYDIEVCEELHKRLKHLPSDLTLDMKFWHWLAIKRLPNFVWLRWNGSVPTDPKLALSRSGMSDRFLGGRTLRGRNRNALSRLYFTAKILHDDSMGYKLVNSAFANQDRHTSIFERQMGMIPSVAKAIVRATNGMGSEDIQRTAKRVNHIGSSLVLETVEEKEVLALLK
jgi:hypothetical protein